MFIFLHQDSSLNRDFPCELQIDLSLINTDTLRDSVAVINVPEPDDWLAYELSSADNNFIEAEKTVLLFCIEPFSILQNQNLQGNNYFMSNHSL